MSGCTCNSGTGEAAVPTELEAAVAEVIQASAATFDEKFAGLIARLDTIEAAITPATTDGDPAADPEVDAVTASPEDTADSRQKELENRMAQLEEAVSGLIVEMTPEMSEI